MDHVTQNWLNALCRSIPGATRAIVFHSVPDGNGYSPIASWPEGPADVALLEQPAKTALAENRCILVQRREAGEETGEPVDVVACPLFVNTQLHGVSAIQMSSRVPARQQAVVQQVEWAAAWLEVLVNQYASIEKGQLVSLVELVASCLEHERFQAAATEVMTELATRLSCDRASIGFLHGPNGHEVTIAAVSHSAGFDRKSGLIRDVGEAMHEAMDQNSTIVFPEPAETVLLTPCHAMLVAEHGIGTILTVPFAVNGRISGAVLVERPAGRLFDRPTRDYLEQIVSIIGPQLELRRRNEQALPQRVRMSLHGSLVRLARPGHLGTKLSLAGIILCLSVLSFTSGDFRITGAARLEARTQRLVVTPQDGYIAAAHVRPGDIINSGDILGALDDKDLRLERGKWSSQLGQLRTEYRDALARHDRSNVSIIKARMLQAEAQLNLVGEKLTRTRFTAPFDGLIVSGDLSQSLGSPVERGQVLFTVAPLDAYRVILKIDERDIGSVRQGQRGILVLSGMPRKQLLFTVEKITPVSTAEEGRNYFRVEARMKENSDLLRPGMEGFAKITINRRRLIWLWSHRLVDWVRLGLWYILP